MAAIVLRMQAGGPYKEMGKKAIPIYLVIEHLVIPDRLESKHMPAKAIFAECLKFEVT
jgi:hypothetical protein